MHDRYVCSTVYLTPEAQKALASTRRGAVVEVEFWCPICRKAGYVSMTVTQQSGEWGLYEATASCWHLAAQMQAAGPAFLVGWRGEEPVVLPLRPAQIAGFVSPTE